jgi:hypothetical protein
MPSGGGWMMSRSDVSTVREAEYELLTGSSLGRVYEGERSSRGADKLREHD